MVCALPAKATHLMGGEMTAEHLGGYDYQVTLTTYRDTLGIPMQTWAFFDVVDTSGATLFTTSADYTPGSGTLLPLFPYGVEVYTFIDTITMPGPGEYSIGWSNCCRNGAIINADDPLAESMYLTTDLTVYDTATAAVNSTPVFLNEPVVFMPVNMPWSYNPLPFDSDGDSLAWHIGVPLDSWGDSIAGYYLPLGDSLDQFTIDPVTGTITWTPIMEGNWVASVVVEEFRGGVRIGSIVRDMQMIVVDSDDSLARFGNLETIGRNDDGYYFEELRVGEEYSLSLIGEDPDAADVLHMAATGEALILDNSPAEFSFVPTGTGNSIEGTFSWTPLEEHRRMEDYITVFRLDDGTFATDLAILFRVGAASTGIFTNDVPQLGATLFPNPATGPVVVRLQLDEADQVAIRVFGMDGRMSADFGTRNLGAGTHDLILPAQSTGQHYVVVEGRSGRRVLPLVSQQ
jgi:hypothetical protein